MMIMAFALMEGEDFMRATLGNALATILEVVQNIFCLSTEQ